MCSLVGHKRLSSSGINGRLQIDRRRLSRCLGNSRYSTSSTRSCSRRPRDSLLGESCLLRSDKLVVDKRTSPTLSFLLGRLPARPSGLPILRSRVGACGKLCSLCFRGIRVTYTSTSPRSVRDLVPNVPLAIVSLYRCPINFCMGGRGPGGVQKFSSLAQTSVVFIGHRGKDDHHVLLSHALLSSRVSPSSVSKCQGRLIASRSATTTITNKRTSVTLNRTYMTEDFPRLSFLPIYRRSLFLIVRAGGLDAPNFRTMTRAVTSRPFHQFLTLRAKCSAAGAKGVQRV